MNAYASVDRHLRTRFYRRVAFRDTKVVIRLLFEREILVLVRNSRCQHTCGAREMEHGEASNRWAADTVGKLRHFESYRPHKWRCDTTSRAKDDSRDARRCSLEINIKRYCLGTERDVE